MNNLSKKFYKNNTTKKEKSQEVKSLGYLVSVNRCPDRTEEEIREYETELIENGQAVRCTECGELLTIDDKGYNEYLCEKCAEKDVKNMLDYLQEVADNTDCKRKNDLQTIKDFCSTYDDIFKMFLLGEVIEYEF